MLKSWSKMNNTANKILLSYDTDSIELQHIFRSSSEYRTMYKVEEDEKSKSASIALDNKPAETNTNNFSKLRYPLLYEQKIFDELLRHNEEVRNQSIKEFVSKLVERMRFYNYDQDSEDMIWPIVDEISAISLSILGSVFQNICIQNYEFPNILCAIAKCLCSYDLTQTAEWGSMILISLLNHKNDTVKEYAVFLLENWKNKSLLPILKNVDCQASWLREYINSVICSLEE